MSFICHSNFIQPCCYNTTTRNNKHNINNAYYQDEFIDELLFFPVCFFSQKKIQGYKLHCLNPLH